MAKYKFSSDLSVKGIKNMIKELEHYRDVELPKKVERYVASLLEVAESKIQESPLGKYVTVTTSLSADKMGCTGILLAKGDVKHSKGFAPFSTLLAIEFGAGIFYNKEANPNADKFGLGVGTFPGQIHAFEDTWFYWDETDQKWKPTHGVRATMPMYLADKEIVEKVVEIAESIF